MAEVWAVIVAAGKGTRMGGFTCGVAKQYLSYRGGPLYAAFARTVAKCRRIRGVAFVLPASDIGRERPFLESLMDGLSLPFVVAAGGTRRQDSVSSGLAALPSSCTAVLVHDAARPFASPALVDRILDALDIGHKGVVPAVGMSDTVKMVRGTDVVGTLDRSVLRAVQTPQGFDLVTLRAAHAATDAEATDDAVLLERLGLAVHVVDGEPSNVKITRPEDLSMLSQAEHRTGYGYDVHAYADDTSSRPLRLGGVLIDGGFRVRAHSDGDVLIHALMDAILGCVGGGDIGTLFPDTDPDYEGADSSIMLAEVLELARDRGFSIRHVDVTIIAQRPKIGPQRLAIRGSLSRLLSLPEESVAVKATTEEGLGFTGGLQGLKVVVLIEGDIGD